MSICNCECSVSCNLSNKELELYVKEAIESMLENGDLVRPDDIYMISQTLTGTILTSTLSNNIKIKTDLDELLIANRNYLKTYVDTILIDLIGAKPDA